MPAADILRAATVNADLSVLGQPRFVMARGRIVQ
jgi:hypothetical protein